MQFYAGKPLLVFCSTRKSCVASAVKIQQDAANHSNGVAYGPSHPFVINNQQYQQLKAIANGLRDRNLAGKFDFNLRHTYFWDCFS